RRGLLRVDPGRLAAVNVHEGMAVFTLVGRQPVDRGETVAKAKVARRAIGADTVRAVEQAARGGAVTVAAFRPAALGTVARETLAARQRERFGGALRTKIDWFGGRLLPVRFAAAWRRAVADEMSALRAEGADVLIVAGASALDPLDPVFGGLTLLGARMERHGAPAHPGSLLFLARWQDLPVLGMPTCGVVSQATTFDLVLPRLRAGATATAEDVNPLCGDRVRMQVTLQDGRVSAARFVGDSCAICTASADVLSELIEGRSRAEASALGAGDVLEILRADVRPTRMR